MKSAFVAIIGRPSAGKSTLMNSLCGEKIAITAPVPQTTRNKIRGILTEKRGQLVFVDTPGFHDSDKKFNQYLTDIVRSALEETDLVLYVVDSSRRPGKEEEQIVNMLKDYGSRIVMALNKVDIDKKHVSELRALFHMNLAADKMINVSALESEGVEELKDVLFNIAPEGHQMYPGDFYTDQPPEFRMAEIIREKAMIGAREELPHAMYVEISDMEMDEEGREMWVRAFLTVERNTQKGIIIGRGASNIKRIRIQSLKEFKRIFPYKVRLDLRVKVNPKWRKKDYLLKGMLN